VEQVSAEAQHLLEQGFRSILLVAGEHPKFVSDGYMEECLEALRDKVPSLALEVGPMETAEYQRMVEAGAESLVVYQETYDEIIYREMHTAGPKKDYNWRLDCPERAYRGGFRRIGVGALMGLADWKTEALGLAAHLEYLYKHCWKSSFTLSLPRLRPAAGGFAPRTKFSDRNLVHLLSALRLSFPDLGLVLSTREPAALRDALLPLCITQMSAGSHTEPGGYTGAGSDDLHYTQRGKRLEISELSNLDKKDSAETGSCATGQFDIADHRSPSDIAALLDEKGFEAVWKDWDPSFLKNNNQLAAL